METLISTVGMIAGLAALVGFAAFGLSFLFDALRRCRERRDELIASERSRKIAHWMSDAAYWFAASDGPASLVLNEIARDLGRGGMFDVAQVRERCRAAEAKKRLRDAAAARPTGEPHA